MFFFVTFFVLSVLYIKPIYREIPTEYRSDILQQKITKRENQERIDYYNENGILTIASDLGYSTKIASSLDNTIKEEYYDPQGKPAKCNGGYYSTVREYNEKKECIYTVYLDIAGQPITIPLGYSAEKNQFDLQGLKRQVSFYDIYGNPVCSTHEGYGKKYGYDEYGRIYKITFVDENGDPMMTDNGYAIVSRTYYLTDGAVYGKVKNEFYFDEKENPIALSLGQYGILREYDKYGENTVVTYLNSIGNPVVTTQGYTTIRREYHEKSYIEKYYDINGNPCKLADGQYGIKKENGQIRYISSDGKEQKNIKMFINNQPLFVILLAILLMIISMYTSKCLNIMLVIIYCGVIFYFTILYRDKAVLPHGWTPFSALKQIIIGDSETLSGIIKNIWLFIPFGTILSRIFPYKKALIIPVALSILIEMIQHITSLGWCELNDVVYNSFGGFIGYGVGKYVCEIKENKKNVKHRTRQLL